MKKSIMTGLVIISVATASLMAFGPHKDGMKHGPKMGRIFQQLNLTDTQKESLKTLRIEQKAQREAIKSSMQESRVAFSTFFTAQGFDKAKFLANSKERFESRINSRADFIEKAYAILDETQKSEFVKLLEERKLKRGK